MMQPVSNIPGASVIYLSLAFLLCTVVAAGAESQFAQEGLWADDSNVESSEDSQLPEVKDAMYHPETVAMLKALRDVLENSQGQQIEDSETNLEKRYKPSGFMGSRGKRYLPGLESLLLAKYYRDAKWKRTHPSGFYGSRG